MSVGIVDLKECQASVYSNSIPLHRPHIQIQFQECYFTSVFISLSVHIMNHSHHIYILSSSCEQILSGSYLNCLLMSFKDEEQTGLNYIKVTSHHPLFVLIHSFPLSFPPSVLWQLNWLLPGRCLDKTLSSTTNLLEKLMYKIQPTSCNSFILKIISFCSQIQLFSVDRKRRFLGLCLSAWTRWVPW